MGIFLIVVHKMAQGGLLALHTQQVLVSGQHDVPGQNKGRNRLGQYDLDSVIYLQLIG